jgi:hypothetical protein
MELYLSWFFRRVSIYVFDLNNLRNIFHNFYNLTDFINFNNINNLLLEEFR